MEASRLHAPVKSEPVCGDHNAHRRGLASFSESVIALRRPVYHSLYFATVYHSLYATVAHPDMQRWHKVNDTPSHARNPTLADLGALSIP